MEKIYISGDPRLGVAIIQPEAKGEIPLYSKIVPAPILVGATPASRAVPSGYFMDLRVSFPSTNTATITADYLVVRDNSSPIKTIGLSAISETNDIDVAGSIVDGRDQAAAFVSQWIYWYIIYNPNLQLVGSLSSTSPTAPTLPTGYTYFMRVGSAYIDGSNNIDGPDSQMGDTHFYRTAFVDQDPSVADTYENLSISSAVPPTAKWVFGYMGLTQNALSNRGMAVASNTSGINEYIATLISVSLVAGYSPSNSVYFSLPLLTAQQISWKASTTDAHYGVIIQGYVDDL